MREETILTILLFMREEAILTIDKIMNQQHFYY